jgi:hypothetical protein
MGCVLGRLDVIKVCGVEIGYHWVCGAERISEGDVV